MPIERTFIATGPAVVGFQATQDEGHVFRGFLTADKGNDPQFRIGGQLGGRDVGVWGHAGQGQDDGHKWGPEQNGYSSKAGVQGTSIVRTGVAGTSVNGVGVYGQTEEDPNSSIPDLLAGVVGAANMQVGVIGWSNSYEGVQGYSFSGVGVRGVSHLGPAVIGVTGFAPAVVGSSNVTGVSGQCGNAGPAIPNVETIAGVVGTSDARPGVIGTSNTQVGIFGFSQNSVGVVGQTMNPASYAGFFLGNVLVSGTLTATVKNGVVAFPDGTQRLLHCMESPEHWFEDFGAGKLKGGRAVVRLDADFAKIIKSGDYRVFVTPEGECRGLSVRRKRAASFEVRELMGGTSSIAFSYRIVGRRKDIRAHERFAKIDTRLPLPRPPRTPKPTPAALRAFIARVEKEARQRASKGAKRARSPRVRAEPLRPPMVLPPRVRAEKK